MTSLAAHYTPEHEMFRDTCRRFFEKEVMPFHMKWEEDGVVPRDMVEAVREDLADRLSVLVAGRVIKTGLPAAIRADEEVRAAYLGHSH